jgi:predicted ribosomally synthesized peptide with SipW-like signal peptide
MKKILLLSLGLIAVIALAASGTWAYFNDIVTSSNTVSAGHIYLNMDHANVAHASVTNLKPGDTGTQVSWAVSINSTMSGNFTVGVGSVANDENDLLAVETLSGDPGSPVGELGSKIMAAFWMDNGSTGKYYLKVVGSGLEQQAFTGSLPEAAYATLDSFGGKTLNPAVTIPGTGTTDLGSFKFDYKFPSSPDKNPGTNYYTDNTAQTDSCAFDVIFSLTQNP